MDQRESASDFRRSDADCSARSHAGTTRARTTLHTQKYELSGALAADYTVAGTLRSVQSCSVPGVRKNADASCSDTMQNGQDLKHGSGFSPIPGYGTMMSEKIHARSEPSDRNTSQPPAPGVRFLPRKRGEISPSPP